MGEDYSSDLRYSKEHEWVRVEGDKAVIGITEYAQNELGDIVFVELPEVGRDIEQMEELGVIESVKTVSTLYAPVSGEVVAVNESLEDTPELINDSAYDEGWIVKLVMADINEVDDLMTADEYKEFVESGGEDE